MFGFHGGLDLVHEVVLRVQRDISEEGELSRPGLGMVERMAWFDEHVIYALLHEPLYCQGTASGWAFDRVLEEEKDFGVEGEKDPYFFTGEMVFRRAFDDYDELKPLKAVANELRRFDEWPDLYDLNQLKRNEVPVFAAVYIDDMYVGYEYATTTAKLIKGCKTLTTNQLYHDAVRGKTEELLKGLFSLRDDDID